MSFEGVGRINPNGRDRVPLRAEPPPPIESEGLGWPSRLAWLACGALLTVALLWLTGCASAKVKITYAEGKGAFGGAAPVVQSVTVEPHDLYGRSCFTVNVDTDGSVGVTVAMDGTSDWAGVRALPLIVPQIVSAVMAVVGAPLDLIGELLGVEREAPPAPSPLSACSAILEQ